MSDILPLHQNWQADMDLPSALWHMFEKQVSCDVFFLAGGELSGERIGAHSLVLMARSPVFFEEFGGELPDNDIDVDAFSVKDFKAFLEYLYTSKTSCLDAEDVDKDAILALGERYNVATLVKELFTHQLENLTVENFCPFVKKNEPSLSGLVMFKCLEFVIRQPKPVFESSNFKLLPKKFVEELLQNEYLELEEEVICSALLQWASFACQQKGETDNGENHRKELGDLVSEIRFPLLNKDYFMANISETGLLLDSEEVQLLKYFLNPKSVSEQRFPFSCKSRKAPDSPFMPNNMEFSSAQNGPLSVTLSAHAQASLPSVPSRPILHTLTAGQHGTFNRFTEESTGWGYRSNKKDAIAFKSNQKIRLDYICIYGVKNGPIEVNLVIRNNQADLTNSNETIQCVEDRHLYEVGVENASGSYGIELEANHEYHIVLMIKSSETGFYGKGGRMKLTELGVDFEFKKSKYSTNNTTESIGQIAGFKFTIV